MLVLIKNISNPGMNLSYILPGVILIFIVLFSSCEDFFISEADQSRIPGSEPQLVIYSYISPQDTLIQVNVFRSKPYSQDPGQYIPVNGDADVYLAKKGENFVQLTYDDELKAFTIIPDDFPVEAGNEYLLKVESHIGEYAEAECFVPEYEVNEVIISQPELTTNPYGEMIIRYDWTIVPENDDKEKYFRSLTTLKTCIFYHDEDLEDLSFCEYRTIWLERGNEFFQDKNGESYSFRVGYNGSFYFDGGGQDYYYGSYDRFDSIFVHVFQTDYHYYRFHQSVENYSYYGDDFPFAEAVHIYSNINGGLGVFAGLNGRRFPVLTTQQQD